MIVELRSAIAISGVAVLTYYAITNASALTLSSDQRRWPRSVAVTGLAGCLVLIVALPAAALTIGVITLTIGATIRLATTARTTPPTNSTHP
ncbi:MAG: hypothetical protein WKF60_01540 [Ilumatobacter sp.]